MNVMAFIESLFEQYGYLVLLIGLPLDFIALPIPGQTTLTYTGYLSYKGVLEWLPAVGVAFSGSIIGITTTYLIGSKLGMPFIERYGKWLFLKPAYLDKTRHWYGKYGNRMLFISFFIPGVRQFFGYFVGIIRVPFRTFALYAYTGAAFWVLVFVGIGYVFGEQWQFVFGLVEEYIKYIFIGLGCVLVTFFFLRWRNRSKMRILRLSKELDKRKEKQSS
ncbi:DedA family protein [Paenibacillus eucommiae]|uniref:Membrane protein DedA with SNARE-associated domain n=1 Tax=Paenibacillus eucommiae TaxID=1355755 RepID=A0ABS4ISU3_9BACL|nr:DedA family protein [Paenibacillus eucommiae]MBP1990620.1 membrane protein DedA with SNARE-associated domain [Paenibacillus eucommiae]